MALSNFIDHVKLYLRAGKGGAGLVHFMRAKFVPKGGPDGGDGGRGGNIILRGNRQLSTLLHLKYRKHIKAPHGEAGKDQCKTGGHGGDVYLDVPLGTVAKKADDDQVLLEVLEDNRCYTLMSGGKGGWGNTRFKRPTCQAPRLAYPGEKGEEGWMVLELKLLADVGLVGFPNAGKSTLLSVVSAAKPEIAHYPFTTLTPNLGVVAVEEMATFVMADLPGLIQGAALGRGLGIRFLRHVERNALLLFVISAEVGDIGAHYALLLEEITQYNHELLNKPRLLALSKMDILGTQERACLLSTLPVGIDWVAISAYTGEGIKPLKNRLWQMIQLQAAHD